jgi:hypothetical protein
VLAPVGAPRQRATADAQGVDPAAVDQLLAGVAASRPHADLVTAVQHYLARLEPDGPEPDPTATRSLTIAKHPDGATTGRWELDAVGSEKVQAALEALCQANRPAGDTRTRASGRPTHSSSCVTTCSPRAPAVPAPDQAAPVRPHRPARPVGARYGARGRRGRVRRRALCRPHPLGRLRPGRHPHRAGPGRPADGRRANRTTRSPHIRRAVEVRDKTCVFAGCQAPKWWCEVHHLREWVLDGGKASLDNSGLLCERHHTQVHHGFRIERQRDGRWRTRRPDGTETHALHRVHDDHPTTRAG